jgi:hypothetical protein
MQVSIVVPDSNQWKGRSWGIVDSIGYAFIDSIDYSKRRGSNIYPLIIENLAFFKDIAECGQTGNFLTHYNHIILLLSEDWPFRRKLGPRNFT